ncbi:MAG: hypothetical protein IPM60_16550 [Rhodospirillales bacterium]|nr:hypothetical protein [Rhodospirillales bacterium]
MVRPEGLEPDEGRAPLLDPPAALAAEPAVVAQPGAQLCFEEGFELVGGAERGEGGLEAVLVVDQPFGGEGIERLQLLDALLPGGRVVGRHLGRCGLAKDQHVG